MLLHLRAVLDADELVRARALLAGASWGDGRVTSGVQSALAKNNEQLPQEGEAARSLQRIVLAALNRHHLFFSAALPRRILPPMFNRYSGGQHFGTHVDGAIRQIPGTGHRLRTDLSCTLFFADPDDYAGGELLIEDTYGAKSVKLPAGHMVLYPSTSLHRVTPVTGGTRLCSFFWLQSLIRDDQRRSMLFDMDVAIQRLSADIPSHPSIVALTGVYHNLLRQWSEM